MNVRWGRRRREPGRAELEECTSDKPPPAPSPRPFESIVSQLGGLGTEDAPATSGAYGETSTRKGITFVCTIQPSTPPFLYTSLSKGNLLSNHSSISRVMASNTIFTR